MLMLSKSEVSRREEWRKEKAAIGRLVSKNEEKEIKQRKEKLVRNKE